MPSNNAGRLAQVPQDATAEVFETPICTVVVASRAGLLYSVMLSPQSADCLLAQVEAEHPGRWRVSAGPKTDVAGQIQKHLSGASIPDYSKITLDENAGTKFQRRVWRATRAVPYGETRSYGWLARKIGAPGASRAVGQAMGKNRFALVVPCHRIIASDGSLGGFGGGLDLKKTLLSLERRHGCGSL